MTWRMQAKKEIGNISLKQEDAPNRTKWEEEMKKMAMRCAATSVHRETAHQKMDYT